MSKTILITGGAGFIGKNLITKLLLETNKKIVIHVIDNFITSSKNDFEHFKKQFDPQNRVTLLEHDICDTEYMTFLRKSFQYDEIYHLASLASPIFYKKFPLETLETGYQGTRNVLEIAKHQKCKVLFSSTSEIYGDAQISPQHEDYYGNVNTFGSRSCYDESKRVAEALCLTYMQLYNTDIKIARIFNTYGPFMKIDDGRIVTECIKHLINDTKLTIFGDGHQTRSCTFIDNTIDMLVRLMASNCNIPINIGNNEEFTINKTVDIIEKVYQEHFDEECKLKKEYVKLTQDDPLKRRPCLKRNKEILGETKYINIKDGILKTINYYVNN